MKSAFKYFFLGFFLLVFAQTEVFSCTCDNEPNFDEMFRDSDAVIKGEAVIVESFGLEIFALIKVEKSWKGISEDKVIIKTDTGSCGVEFEVGDTYYLWVDEVDKSFVTMPCRDYGEKQISFLKDKPTLPLKSSNVELKENANTSADNANVSPELEAETNKIQTRERSSQSRPNYVFYFAVSVTLIVFCVMALIVGFFFWKNRKR